MDLAAKHIGFVAAAYGLSGLVLAGLFLWVVLTGRSLRAQSAKAEGGDSVR